MPGPDVQQLPGGGGLTSYSFCTCPLYFAWVFLSYLMPSHFIGILSLGPCILFYLFRGLTGTRQGYWCTFIIFHPFGSKGRQRSWGGHSQAMGLDGSMLKLWPEKPNKRCQKYGVQMYSPWAKFPLHFSGAIEQVYWTSDWTARHRESF